MEELGEKSEREVCHNSLWTEVGNTATVGKEEVVVSREDDTCGRVQAGYTMGLICAPKDDNAVVVAVGSKVLYTGAEVKGRDTWKSRTFKC